jgi:hypothetical protein
MTTVNDAFERIATALERIADAQEMVAGADPLAMLDAVLQEQGVPGEVQEPLTSNGQTILYRHPLPDLHIVLRKDERAEGGYAVSVERA